MTRRSSSYCICVGVKAWRWGCQGESQTTAAALGTPGRVTDYSRGAGDARASHRLQPRRTGCQDESQTTVVALGMPGRVTDYSQGAGEARTSHRLQSWRWGSQGESQTTAVACMCVQVCMYTEAVDTLRANDT